MTDCLSEKMPGPFSLFRSLRFLDDLEHRCRVFGVFDEWRFQRKLRKLQKAKNEDAAKYRKLYEAAKYEGTPQELDSINGEAYVESQLHQATINDFTTAHLRQTAEALMVPIPPITGEEGTYWRRNDIYKNFVLTSEGIKKVRDDIHEEIKKQWERRFIWLQPVSTFISLLIALGGIATAILSLWHKL
jgi:hypothetical protein